MLGNSWKGHAQTKKKYYYIVYVSNHNLVAYFKYYLLENMKQVLKGLMISDYEKY